MKKNLAIFLIAGISLIMLITTVATAQMAEVTPDSINVQDKCEKMKESLAIATGLRVEYIQKQIDMDCS